MSESDRGIVVSGRRFAQMANAVEAAPGAPAVPAPKSDVAALVGAQHVEQAVGSGPDVRALSDVEKASMVMRFNVAKQLLEDADVHPGVFSTVENQLAAVIQSALAERAAQDASKLTPAAAQGREAKFDERDVRWVLSLLTWVGKLKPHPWKPLPSEPETFDKDLKFAMVGDWGTGLYGAPKCAASISAAGGFDYVVHLGDIYYSGTMGEAQANFVDKWVQVAGARYRACNGNHEMYSGGYGYFDLVLPAFSQPSSCFVITNPNWLIVGLDSAYADHDLVNEQADWVKTLADADPGKKLTLLTHHQPFSHFDPGGEKLVEKLMPLLSTQRITAWYWGHEHRCVVYDRHPQWNFFGRCIGHGGYPYFREPSLKFAEVADPKLVEYAFWREIPADSARGAPRAILLDGPNPDLGAEKDDYGLNGYVTLEFTGATLTERFFLPTGEQLTENQIS
jgi:hypothetical protein